MAGAILAGIFFLIIIIACCATSGDDSSNTTSKTSSNNYNRNSNSSQHSHIYYDECPACGAPGFDGYCDECGFSDINQGWLGEEYG